ncbi:MAG: TetR/AcrR family transcriptional regulator [Alphaproteobacteria bacterium]|nr:TetR/AcrR family transcriptional regulator [Alphaproteobacteria bacterium]
MTKRLSRQDWIAHGFEVLKTEGHEGLKADRMVKALNVSRGSFYWHFKSIDGFHAALLSAWREQITEAVIAELRDIGGAENQLTELISRVILTPQRIEAAMRSWGRIEPKIAMAVAAVDTIRIDYITDVIAREGIPQDIARGRAIMLSWSYIGRALSPDLAATLDHTVHRDLGRIFLSPDLDKDT